MARSLIGTKKQDEFIQLCGDPFHITADSIVKMFAYTKSGNGIRFNPDDIIAIGPKDSPFVVENGETTVGIYIANKFLFEDLAIFGYINKTLNAKAFKKIDDELAKALEEGDVTREQVGTYIDKCQYLFGGPLAHIINTSLTSTLMVLPPSAKKLREKLFKEHEAELAANDPEVAHEIEVAVVDEALREMRKTNDPALALYDSGCGIDPYNNYRTMFVMKGAIADNTGLSPTGYKIVKSNYNDGISKDDVPLIADTLVKSAYFRGVATQDSGAAAKSYNAISQRIRLQDRGSFCHTTRTNTVEITEGNKNKYVYRYIKTSAKEPVMLTLQNIDGYVGKTVDMYSPLHCKAHDPEYCSICVGDRPYRIGVKNVGLTFSIITGSTMNAALKVMHNTSVELYRISINDIVKYMNHPLV